MAMDVMQTRPGSNCDRGDGGASSRCGEFPNPSRPNRPVDLSTSVYSASMLRLLDRSILSELLRTGLLTAAILVTVIAFGAAIKPLSNESLFSAFQIAKYIVLAMVPMLQFALPFAAGFAGTMVFHRMTGENEVVAASAGGLSYRRILRPVIVLGLALSIAMVGLTQFVIPRFWGLLEKTVAQDVAVLFERTLGSGEPFQMGDLQVWADDIIAAPEQAPEGASTRLVLLKVAVADLGVDGEVVTDVTADEVVIDIYRRPHETVLSLAMADTVAFRPQEGMLAWMERPDATTIRIPTTLRDSPKRMTLPELLTLLSDTDQHNEVNRVRRELASTIREEQMWRDIEAAIARDGEVLLDGGSGGMRWRIRAASVARGKFAGPDEQVRVEQLDPSGARLRSFDAAQVRLRPGGAGGLGAMATGLTVGEAAPEDGVLTLRLVMEDVVWRDELGNATGQRAQIPIENLSWADEAGVELLDEPSASLLALADTAVPRAENSASRLRRVIENLKREIRAKMVSRYAFSMTALLLVMFGALLAMFLHRATPLVIYSYAFLPSVLDLILIKSGEQLVRDDRVIAGFSLMWSGNLLLIVLIMRVYFKLRRN